MSSIRLCIRLLIKTSRARERLSCLGIRPDSFPRGGYPGLPRNLLWPIVVCSVGLGICPRGFVSDNAVPCSIHGRHHRRQLHLCLCTTWLLLCLLLLCLTTWLLLCTPFMAVLVIIILIIISISIVGPLTIIPLRPFLLSPCPFVIRGSCNLRWGAWWRWRSNLIAQNNQN